MPHAPASGAPVASVVEDASGRSATRSHSLPWGWIGAASAAATGAAALLVWLLPHAVTLIELPRLWAVVVLMGTALLLALAAAAWLRAQSGFLTTLARHDVSPGVPAHAVSAPSSAAAEALGVNRAAAAQECAPSRASPLGWQIELMRRLPGVSLLLQPTGSDWILIAAHRAMDPASASAVARSPVWAAPWSDLPQGLSHERLQALSALLGNHPSWPAEAIRRALEVPSSVTEPAATPAEPAAPTLHADRLPLSDGACIVWFQPPAPAETGPAAPPAGEPTEAATVQEPAPHTAELDERESIAYSVSHDLRAPIRVIEGFTRIVREDYGQVLDRVGNDHLERVLGATTRMNHMIDALLALSRLSSQPLNREPVALSEMATQIALELRQQAPDRQVEFMIQPDLRAEGDPTLLRCVLENLVGNAWKYSARRSVARIEFSASLQEAATAASPQGPARLVYAVRDNGAGFDMRFAQRLFAPFQRLHSASEFAGHGVGLASVRRIVRRHGGDIWAEAQVDLGAAFYFTLG